MTKKPNQPNQQEWEERFDKLRYKDLGTQKQRDWVYKQFIRQLLKEEREKVIKEIEKLIN